MDRVVRTNGELGSDSGELPGGRQHQVCNAAPVSGSDVHHIFRQRMGVHGDFGMQMLSQE